MLAANTPSPRRARREVRWNLLSIGRRRICLQSQSPPPSGDTINRPLMEHYDTCAVYLCRRLLFLIWSNLHGDYLSLFEYSSFPSGQLCCCSNTERLKGRRAVHFEVHVHCCVVEWWTQCCLSSYSTCCALDEVCCGEDEGSAFCPRGKKCGSFE